MSCSSDDFKQGMRRLAAGVTVITTCHQGERTGMTATAVCSLSATPARLLACVNLNGSTYRFASASRRMAINVLALSQEDVAREFSRPTTCRDDLFSRSGWREVDGLPLLNDATAVFECAIEQMLVMDTHAVMIGTVERVHVSDAPLPLLYADGAYASLGVPPIFQSNESEIRRSI